MPLNILLVITLLIPFNLNAATPENSPKYSSLKKMSQTEFQKILESYTGTNDTWKEKRSLTAKALGLLPFQKKRSSKEEVLSASRALSLKSPNALQNYAVAIHHSQNQEVREMIATVQGDKMIAFKNYTSLPPAEPRSMVFFFQLIEYGDTGIEKKQFSEFVWAFDQLSYIVERAYERSLQFNMPMILEFESSALIEKSPLTKLFFNSLANHPEQIMKAEVTPDGGRILAIHPYYAKEIVRSLKLFSNQFELSVNSYKSRIFSDKDSKNRLIDLLKTGEGISGLLYTEERMQELAIKAKSSLTPPGMCARIFSGH